MNKFIKINKGKPSHNSSFGSGTTDEFNDLKVFLLRLIRLWFAGESNLTTISRDLNIKYGYFRGCRLMKALNELFIFIKSYNSLLLINHLNDIQISNDEQCLTQLIFPNLESKKGELGATKNFVPEEERELLVRLAKAVNLSLI
tara:strand:+ start:96 stop:527 length:432 start_codon:yes stop_codon:yes gene_type:complete